MSATDQFLKERAERKNLAIQLQANVNRLADLLRRKFELEGELARITHDAKEIAERQIFNGSFLTSEVPGAPRYFVEVSEGCATWHEVHAPEQWVDAHYPEPQA